MKKKIFSLYRVFPAVLMAASLLLLGCDQDDIHTQDTGGVTLVQSIPATFPWRVSVNNNDSLQLEGISLTSVVTNPTGTSSTLMDIRLNTMEVTYTRADGGARVPDPLVRRVFTTVPAGSSTELTLTIMSLEQFRLPPLSDLLFENGGFDSETGRTNIKMNAVLKFYGETLGGKTVTTEPRALTMEFIP